MRRPRGGQSPTQATIRIRPDVPHGCSGANDTSGTDATPSSQAGEESDQLVLSGPPRYDGEVARVIGSSEPRVIGRLIAPAVAEECFPVGMESDLFRRRSPPSVLPWLMVVSVVMVALEAPQAIVSRGIEGPIADAPEPEVPYSRAIAMAAEDETREVGPVWGVRYLPVRGAASKGLPHLATPMSITWGAAARPDRSRAACRRSGHFLDVGRALRQHLQSYTC